MRIAFIVIGNSRRSNYLNGITMRYGGGGASGTDTSNILIAEYLASQGHEVYYGSDELEPELEGKNKENKPIGQKINGVIYTDINFTHTEDKIFDILVSNLWYDKYNELPIKITNGLIYWSHMQWMYGVSEMHKFVKENHLKLGIVNISNWEYKMNEGSVLFLKENHDQVYQTIIPNPLVDDVLEEVHNMNIPKKKGKFIYHAAWARGGNVAFEMVNKLNTPNKELYVYDYLMTIHEYKEDFFKIKNSVDKKTLYQDIAESEYFIYPLYTPYKDVHKDTFSCVVAEAIALGTTPITYPLGALEENFDGFCVWADFPEGVNPADMNNEPLSKDEDGFFNTPKYLSGAYLKSENNPTIKLNVQNNGYKEMTSKFSTKIVGGKWVEFLKNFES